MTMNQLQFLRALAILNGAVPVLMLTWDAWQGQLGANSVNNALHITGILSLGFLFLSLLMTPLRQMTGWGGWVAFRRTLGLYGFFYAVLHLVIYVGFDRAFDLTSTLHEILTRRFLQVGAVAMLMMVPLAVTSTNRMIQRIGPKRWKLLHRAAYVVAILGVLHYYMLVKSDVRQPLAFAGVLTILLSGRFGRHYYELQQTAKKSASRITVPTPVKMLIDGVSHADASAKSVEPGKSHLQWKGELRIGAIFQETPDVKTFRLVAKDGGSFPFAYQPGQFLNLRLMIDGKRVNRSYTLASSPTHRDSCELSIKREPMGLASRHIHDQLHVGDVLNVSGPSGRFIFTGNETSSVLLIAGGVGITPVMSITRYLTDRAWSGDIYFLIVAKTEQDLVFHDEIEWLKKRFPQLHVCATLTQCDANSNWTGARGRLTGSLIQRFVPELIHMPVYLCGPNEMMDATKDLLRNVGVPDSQVRTEAFAGRKSAAGTVDAAPETFEAGDNTESRIANDALPLAKGKVRTIRFVRSSIQAELIEHITILEAAEAASIALQHECRSGICGQCKTRLIEGTVQMDCEDALSASEKANGLILACQAWPQSNVVIDA